MGEVFGNRSENGNLKCRWPSVYSRRAIADAESGEDDDLKRNARREKNIEEVEEAQDVEEEEVGGEKDGGRGIYIHIRFSEYAAKCDVKS